MEPPSDPLDDDLLRLDRALQSHDLRAARHHLATFGQRLTTYLRHEERTLFPLLEGDRPAPYLPTARMRREHVMLRQLVVLLWDALAERDRQRQRQLVSALRSVLMLHLTKEAWVLQPLLPRAGEQP